MYRRTKNLRAVQSLLGHGLPQRVEAVNVAPVTSCCGRFVVIL